LILVSGPRLRAACKPAILVTGAVGYGGSVLLQNIGIERTSVTHAALLLGAPPVLVAIMAATLGHRLGRPPALARVLPALRGLGRVHSGARGSGPDRRRSRTGLDDERRCAGAGRSAGLGWIHGVAGEAAARAGPDCRDCIAASGGGRSDAAVRPSDRDIPDEYS